METKINYNISLSNALGKHRCNGIDGHVRDVDIGVVTHQHTHAGDPQGPEVGLGLNLPVCTLYRAYVKYISNISCSTNGCS